MNLKSDEPEYFSQLSRFQNMHFDDISSPLDERGCSLLSDAIPLHGFHGNTDCLTAALQGLFSAAGSSLTPVCQGAAGIIEGEYDPAHTGMQRYFFFHASKS